MSVGETNNIRYADDGYQTAESLLKLRKELIKKAIEDYNPSNGIGGYTILRAARDGLIKVVE